MISKDRIKPLGNRLAVQLSSDTEVSGTGILVLNSKEGPVQGKVIATGPNCDFPIGSTVLCGRYAGDDLRVEDNEKWVLVKILHSDSVACFI